MKVLIIQCNFNQQYCIPSCHVVSLMANRTKECRRCGQANHFRRNACINCGVSLKPGRPRRTTEVAGFSVGHNGGRPQSTTREAGYCAGRPRGTTRDDGFNVGSGRPRGTTRAAAYNVSSGRPHGNVEFHTSIQLPSDWDHSDDLVNVTDVLLEMCGRRITQQRTFDKKPLGLAVCYGCGHLLWSTVDGGHTFLVDKPSGMSEDEAPASAYLRAVPSCTAGFVYTERGTSNKERWYSCPYCKSSTISSIQHIGCVLDPSGKYKAC